MLYQHSGIEAQKMIFEEEKLGRATNLSHETLMCEMNTGLRKPDCSHIVPLKVCLDSFIIQRPLELIFTFQVASIGKT